MMLRTACLSLALVAALALPARAEDGASLRGSPSSMVRQHRVAEAKDYTFLRTPAQLRRFVDEGYLVPLEGNGDYGVAAFVSFPVARPELRTFVERLAAQYRAGCGERLIVTSLTRPRSVQPANAHALSVHPTGMAVDLRVSKKGECREWLEDALLSLERREMLDVTRERNPPHYHVAVFPHAYGAYVQEMLADSVRGVEALAAAERLRGAARMEPAAVQLQQTSLGPRVERSQRSGREGWISLAMLALAPLGLALGLRRGSHGRGTSEDFSE